MCDCVIPIQSDLDDETMGDIKFIRSLKRLTSLSSKYVPIAI